MPETPLLYKSAVELGRMIREREMSSVELTQQYLDALDKRGRELNAVAELTPELALEQAKKVASNQYAHMPVVRAMLDGLTVTAP